MVDDEAGRGGGSMTKMAGSKFGEDIFVAIWREESVVTWHPSKEEVSALSTFTWMALEDGRNL